VSPAFYPEWGLCPLSALGNFHSPWWNRCGLSLPAGLQNSPNLPGGACCWVFVLAVLGPSAVATNIISGLIVVLYPAPSRGAPCGKSMGWWESFRRGPGW